MLGKQSGVCSYDSKSSGGTSCVTLDSTKDGFKSNTDSEGSEFSVSNNSLFRDRSTPVYSRSLSFPLSDPTPAGNGLNLFENKSSCDFLCDDLREIGSFDDVDMIFRRSDSTFGLEDSEEDGLVWLSSEYEQGESREALRSEFVFPCHETNMRANVSENHGSSMNYTEMSDTPIWMKDVSGTQEKSESYTSFVNGLGICDGKYGFIPEEQGYPSAHMSQQVRATGRNSIFYVQNNGSQSYSDNSQLSDQASVTFADSTSGESWVSSHPSLFTALSGTDNEVHIHTFQSNLSSQSTSLMEQSSIQDPGLVRNQVKLCGDKFENPADAGGVNLVFPVEPGSSNIQENSMITTAVDDITLAAATLYHLQLVMEWATASSLILKTSICNSSLGLSFSCTTYSSRYLDILESYTCSTSSYKGIEAVLRGQLNEMLRDKLQTMF